MNWAKTTLCRPAAMHADDIDQLATFAETLVSFLFHACLYYSWGRLAPFLFQCFGAIQRPGTAWIRFHPPLMETHSVQEAGERIWEKYAVEYNTYVSEKEVNDDSGLVIRLRVSFSSTLIFPICTSRRDSDTFRILRTILVAYTSIIRVYCRCAYAHMSSIWNAI